MKMNNDLINRQETYKELISRIDYIRDKDYELYCEIGDVIQDCVENISTTYNIDKVVKEIKDLMWFYKDCSKYGNKDVEQQKKSYGTTLNYEVADYIEEIIDIVKDGGKNE